MNVHDALALPDISPRTRCRWPQALSLAGREEISRGIARGGALRQIACRLARSASTLGREIRRNGGSERYQADGLCCASSRQSS